MSNNKKYQLVLVKSQEMQVAENVVYLGEWCHSYPVQNGENSKQFTLPYHWDDREKLYCDFQYLQELNDQLVSELKPVLNQLHKVDEDERYWRLVLGYWVNLYTAVLFDRWSSIEGFVGKFDLADFEISGKITAEMQSDTLLSFNQDILEDSWNESLFLMVLEYYGNNYEVVPSMKKKVREPESKSIRQTLKVFFNKVSSYIGRNDEIMMIDTYLSNELLIGLYKRLGMYPRYWFDFSMLEVETNAEMRDWSLHVPVGCTLFERMVRELMPKMLPKTLIEGFEGIQHEIDRHGWPARPKVIFTSVKHYSSEIFVCWAARSQKHGARLVLGEHGGYGVGKFNGAVSFQMKVADRFLSTGWLEKTVPTSPIGNFRTAGRKQTFRSDGKLLMVTVAMPRYSFDIRSMVIAGQMSDYFSDQFKFANSLPLHIRGDLIVRLCPVDYDWNQLQRWKDRVREVELDDVSRPMWQAFEDCRLFVSTYNATTYVDALALNVPTVIFWNPEHWEVKSEAVPFFDELEKVGIFHSTPLSAAKHIEKIWDNVNSWWFSEEVQHVVAAFCERYSATPSDILDRLETAIRAEEDAVEHALNHHSL